MLSENFDIGIHAAGPVGRELNALEIEAAGTSGNELTFGR